MPASPSTGRSPSSSTPRTPAKRAKASRKKPPTDLRDVTLAQFSQSVDAYLNTDAGFSDLVLSIWTARKEIAALKAARKEIHEEIKARYFDGTRSVGLTGYELRQSDPGEAVTYRAVESAVVKKRAAEAWKRAHVVAPFVAIKAPAAASVPKLRVRLPKMDSITSTDLLVTAYKEHPAWQRLKEAVAAETEFVGRLSKLAAEAGWDGMPITFADGWQAQLVREQFSGDRLKEIEPELFEALAVTKVKAAAARVFVAKVGSSEAVDLDGE